MLRWIVSITALIVVGSAFAKNNNDWATSLGDTGWNQKDKYGQDDPYNKKGGSFCDIPVKCDPPTNQNCVPEPTSMAALAIGGITMLKRRKKKQS